MCLQTIHYSHMYMYRTLIVVTSCASKYSCTDVLPTGKTQIWRHTCDTPV